MNKTTNEYRAILKCIECYQEYDLESIIFRCSACDGLLEVRHDINAIKNKSATEWKDIFTNRFRSSNFPYSSGVWGKKEWVLPGIDNNHIVSLGEGATPLLKLDRFIRDEGIGDVFVKQCGVTHTGSFKDLGMTVLVSHVRSLIARGIKIRAVVCASTGDTSAALSSYAAAAGIPTIVFLPAGKISTAQLIQPISNGSIVLSLDTDFDGCMSAVRSVTENDSSLYLANSMNPLRIEGQKTISIEICQQLNWNVPDWILIPGGNLGNVSALGAGFRLLYETGIIKTFPRICLAQSHNANPMFRSYQADYGFFKPITPIKTLASAIQIGNPVSYPRARRTLQDFHGIVEEATENELADAAARLDRYGLFNDPHTGVVLACMLKLLEKGEIKSSESVVVISTAHGLKFTEFKTGYHEKKLGDVESKYANTPHQIRADLNSVQDALNRFL